MKRNQWGVLNPHWKGGRFKNKNGYVWLYMPEHPNASKVSPRGYVLEHRYVMEQKILRYLKSWELVHHINGIKDDNRLENLEIKKVHEHIGDHNRARVHTKESKEKHSIVAKNMVRDNFGRFTK